MVGVLIFLGVIGFIIFKACQASIESQEMRNFICDSIKRHGGKVNPSDTYIDGFGTTRYVNDNSKFRGGQYSDNPAERARFNTHSK